MRKYGMLKAVYLSFYSQDFYKDVVKNWGGYTIVYLLLLNLFAWIIVFDSYRTTFIEFYTKFSHKIVSQLPQVNIKNGTLHTPQKRPYYIEDGESKANFAVIDTSGKYKTLVEANTDILVTKTQVITRGDDGETKIYSIPNNLTKEINFQSFDENLKKIVPYLWVPIFFVLMIFSFFYRLFQSLVYALLGKLFSLIIKANLTYGQIIQIAIVALTPTILLATLFDYLHIVFQSQYKVYFLVAVAYLLYGINANKIRE